MRLKVEIPTETSSGHFDIPAEAGFYKEDGKVFLLDDDKETLSWSEEDFIYMVEVWNLGEKAYKIKKVDTCTKCGEQIDVIIK